MCFRDQLRSPASCTCVCIRTPLRLSCGLLLFAIVTQIPRSICVRYQQSAGDRYPPAHWNFATKSAATTKSRTRSRQTAGRLSLRCHTDCCLACLAPSSAATPPNRGAGPSRAEAGLSASTVGNHATPIMQANAVLLNLQIILRRSEPSVLFLSGIDKLGPIVFCTADSTLGSACRRNSSLTKSSSGIQTTCSCLQQSQFNVGFASVMEGLGCKNLSICCSAAKPANTENVGMLVRIAGLQSLEQLTPAWFWATQVLLTQWHMLRTFCCPRVIAKPNLAHVTVLALLALLCSVSHASSTLSALSTLKIKPCVTCARFCFVVFCLCQTC